jgi:hypothetical protein
MRYYDVWRGDEYLGVYYEDELWQLDGESWICLIDIST